MKSPIVDVLKLDVVWKGLGTKPNRSWDHMYYVCVWVSHSW